MYVYIYIFKRVKCSICPHLSEHTLWFKLHVSPRSSIYQHANPQEIITVIYIVTAFSELSFFHLTPCNSGSPMKTKLKLRSDVTNEARTLKR